MILPVILYGCEMGAISSNEIKFRMFESRVVRAVYSCIQVDKIGE